MKNIAYVIGAFLFVAEVEQRPAGGQLAYVGFLRQGRQVGPLQPVEWREQPQGGDVNVLVRHTVNSS